MNRENVTEQSHGFDEETIESIKNTWVSENLDEPTRFHTVNQLDILCKATINLRFEYDKMFGRLSNEELRDIAKRIVSGIVKLDINDIDYKLGTSSVFELGKAIGASDVIDAAWTNTVIDILVKYRRKLMRDKNRINAAITCKWEELMNEGVGGYPGGNVDHSCTIIVNVLESDFRTHDVSSSMWLRIIEPSLAKISDRDKYFLEVTKVVEKDK